MKRKVSLCIGIAIIVGWFIVSQFFLEQTLTQTKQLEEYVKTLEGKLSESDDSHFALKTKIRILQEQIVQLEKDKKEECKPCESPTKGKEGLENLAYDYAAVSRLEMNNLLNLGVPLDSLQRTPTKDALIIYPTKKTIPTDDMPVQLNATKATENCASVKLILQDAIAYRKQCLVIMPQYESYHVHKFMRLPRNTQGKQDITLPLRHVSRSHKEDGTFPEMPTLKSHLVPFRKTLIEYYERIEHIIGTIKPMLQSMHSKHSSKTIIVLVCNYGQSKLLHNFVCNARAKGIEINQIFLFATDQKTYELAQSLNITTFYDKVIFGGIPEQAAGVYGDAVFGKIMMAKVYCVHLILNCGLNVLFQDVDVVWFRNPLPYLESSPTTQEWDMMFQDDGNRQIRYAPFGPNTGFYFVRNNERTMYLFEILLRYGDSILKSRSHQEVLSSVMNEFVSAWGLRVKTFAQGPTTLFPGGKEFHHHHDAMKRWITSPFSQKPYVLHMSWTLNEKVKTNFFRQVGEWYLDDNCSVGSCCLREPNITCHYRDKPSYIYCGDVPPLDKGKPSFWKDQKEIDDMRHKNFEP